MDDENNSVNAVGKIFHKTGLFLIYKNSIDLIDLKKGNSLLDIGCGTGKILHRLKKGFGDSAKLFGIDPDPEKIEAAKSENPDSKISFKIAYASDLPHTNNSLDWVISTLTFHHMPPEEKGRAIGEIARVLKPGGKFLITDFGRPKGVFGKIFAWLSKNHAYTKDNMAQMEQLLLKNNFQIIKTDRTWGWIEHILATLDKR